MMITQSFNNKVPSSFEEIKSSDDEKNGDKQ